MLARGGGEFTCGPGVAGGPAIDTTFTPHFGILTGSALHPPLTCDPGSSL